MRTIGATDCNLSFEESAVFAFSYITCEIIFSGKDFVENGNNL
jgi:hypothetical protein